MAAEEVVIVPYRDGPYLVRGPVVLQDQQGRGIEPGRRTIALCRCGKSRMRPFCDGTHRLIRFQVPSTPETGRATAFDPESLPAAAASGRAAPARKQASRTNGSTHEQLEDQPTVSSERTSDSDPVACALALLAGARLLVERSATASTREMDWVAPCLCLVRGAIEALVPAAGTGNREVPKVIEQLVVLAALLEMPPRSQ